MTNSINAVGIIIMIGCMDVDVDMRSRHRTDVKILLLMGYRISESL